MQDKAAYELATAIIGQAVDDWRSLCRGGGQSRDKNFKELEEFFTTDCDALLMGESVTAEAILKRLKAERFVGGLAMLFKRSSEKTKPSKRFYMLGM